MGLRILLLTTDAYGGHGGIAYYNRCLAEALADMPEVEEVVIVPRISRFSAAEIPPKIRFLAQAIGGKMRFLRTLAGLAGERFDLVICGHINLLPLAAPFAALKRAPLVLQVHGIDAWQPPRPVVRMWLGRVSAVWSVSAVTRDRMNGWARLPLSRYTIIPNTIHLDRYGMAPPRADLIDRYKLHGRKVIMTLARLASEERYKGIDEILEAMPALVEQEHRLVYMVVGDGDDLPRLRAKAEALGIADRVIFPGYVDEGHKADHLRLADVFALPGRGEGFGIVYLEAMACGVPVVGSLLDGSREALCDGKLGELADPTDPVSIKRCIVSSLGRERGVSSDLSYFDWPHFQNRLVAILQQLALPRKAGP